MSIIKHLPGTTIKSASKSNQILLDGKNKHSKTIKISRSSIAIARNNRREPATS